MAGNPRIYNNVTVDMGAYEFKGGIFTVTPTPNQTVCPGTTLADTFTAPTYDYANSWVANWTNSNTAIGLAASGFGTIAPFTATNATNTPQTSTITVMPTVTSGSSLVIDQQQTNQNIAIQWTGGLM